MLNKVSEQYKTLIYDEDSEQSIIIKINGVPVDSDYVKDLKLDDKVFNNNSFALGSAIPSQITLTLDNDALKDFNDFDEMSFDFLLYIENKEEIIPLGNYVIVNRDNNTDFITKFVLNDYLKKLDVEYDISEYLPCTRYKVYEHICEDFGLEIGTESFINGDVIMNVYDSSFKAKDYLMYFSERAGGYCKCLQNKIFIKSFGSSILHELPVDKAGEYKTDKTRIISKVVYANATQLFEAGDNTGETVYLSQDSPLSCSQEEVDKIYNILNGLNYQSLDVRIWGDPSIDTGEMIKFGDIQSFAQKSWSFGNGFYGNYKTTFNEETTAPPTNKISAKIRKLQSTINEQAGDIKIINQELIDNNEQLTEFEMSLEKISQEVKNTKDVVDASVEIFKVNLDNSIIIIPTTYDKKPIMTANYDINYDVFYFGKKITLQPTTSSENEGIVVKVTDNYIRFSVGSDTSIGNLDNKFIFDFIYTNEEGISSTLTRTVILCLAVQGKNGENGQDGAAGKDATVQSDIAPTDTSQMWLDTTTNELKRWSGIEWIVVNDFSEEISDIRTKTEQNSTDINNKYQDLNKKFDNYATLDGLATVTNSIEQLQTDTSWSLNRIKEIEIDGVGKVVVGNGMTFDEKGLNLDRTGSPVGTVVNEAGMKIIDKSGSQNSILQYSGYVDGETANENENLKKYEGQTINYSKNIVFEQYFSSKNYRIEEVEDAEHGIGLGFFYIGE